MNMRDGSTRPPGGHFAALLPALAYEGSSTVNFNVTGTIEAPSCEVAVEPSNSIDLGTVSSQTFSGHAGASGASVPVKLVFSSCSADASAVTIAFSGTSFDSTHASIYKTSRLAATVPAASVCSCRAWPTSSPLAPATSISIPLGTMRISIPLIWWHVCFRLMAVRSDGRVYRHVRCGLQITFRQGWV